MSFVNLDVSRVTNTCKDLLSAEWTEYKKSGTLKREPVCRYAVGGPRDNPVAALASVSKGVTQWELLLRDVVDCKKPEGSPVLGSEVVVGGDCSVSVYPPRHAKGEATHSPAYVISLTPATAPSGKRKKVVQKSPEEQFLVMVEQAANYMLDHLKKVCQPAVPIGNMNAQYLILGSAALIKNRLNYYKDLLRLPSSKTHSDTVARANELTDVLSETVLNYHCDVMRSCLMHDADSHDWTHDKQYRDGEYVTTAVHMWIFYIQGVRSDLYRHCSVPVAQSILSSVLSDTLNILLTRYHEVCPSVSRLPLYRADVLSVLALVAAILPSLTSCPEDAVFFGGDNIAASGDNTAVIGLHRRAQLLFSISAVKSAPIELILSHNKDLLHTSTQSLDSLYSSEPSIPQWLTFLQPVLYPVGVKEMSCLPPTVAAYHLLMAAACVPAPNWPLLVRGLISHGLAGGRTLLAGLREYWSGARASSPCRGALCSPHLCAPPLTPQTVYAAVVYVLLQCCRGRHLLRRLMFPDAIKPSSWDSLDQSQVWNSQRPPWHHTLVMLSVPAVLPSVAKMVQGLPAEAPAQPTHPSQLSVRLEHHLTAWLLQLMQGVQANVTALPLCLIQLCQELQRAIAPTARPAAQHVMGQILLGALYSVLSSRHSLSQLRGGAATTTTVATDDITDGQWTVCEAMAERLCGLDACSAPVQQQATQMTQTALARLSSEGLRDEEDSEPLWTDPLQECEDRESAEADCEAIAASLLSTAQGQHSLGMVREFLQHNMEWVVQQLAVPPLVPVAVPSPPRSTPALSQLVFSPAPLLYNPLYYSARILYARFDQEGALSCHKSDWDAILSSVRRWLPSSTTRSLLSTRCELHDGAVLTDSQQRVVDELVPLLELIKE